ncbi:uroporphyrinogen-III C-methyltransferase [Pedobacter yulinensis]|uniref:uroporphyrinogen-III C-methyltransferase n=1 Tax=Pedobacter yulinensis TaxID=2126353 RepID=A0A2T3HLX7_9SPHI|nr:uroporphyrinogen-III C-methyltransferase [Pedobacter yulinensis]PST83452.1 uroporphyrinogen-III C-methyltransferase [Pedobacter yulinensis]
MRQKEPRITLVGAGPGDPDLITLKGLKALQTADVVLYDALVGDAMLDHVPAGAVKIYVGKRSGEHAYAQETINKLMVDYALNYGHVVRLKGGDPFVFGRGFEELEFAAAHQIPAAVVPGISSSIAVAGLQQIPVTHRGMSESFWVVTGTTAAGALSADIYDAARSNATVVVLMGLKKLEEIAAVFTAEGKHDLPVAIIQDGSTKNERIVTAPVSRICAAARSEQVKAPAVLIFGEVVSLHASFKPLQQLYAGVAEK